MTVAIQEASKLIARMRRDPILFVRTFWPAVKLAEYQVQILESVRDCGETWVHSSNESGKSWIAAVAALWFFCTRPSIVITTAPTETHLRSILWAEICTLLRSATLNGQPAMFGFVVNELEIRHKDEAGAKIPRYFMLGRVAEKVESLQGYHLAELADGSPTVFFLFDEASAIRPEFFEAASAQAHTTLIIGNPLTIEGPFYQACRSGDQKHPDGSGRLFRKVLHVSGDHSPNVIAGRAWEAGGKVGKCPRPIPGILSWEQYQERLANWPPMRVRTRLLGLFPDEAGQKLFPPEWLDIAQALGRKIAAYNSQPGQERGRLRTGRPFALGIDVAHGGGDLTSFCVLGRWGVPFVWNAELRRWEWAIFTKPTPDTQEIPGTTLRLMKRFNIAPQAVAFDSGGGGQQIADQLRGHGYDVSNVDFGSTEGVDTAEYKNRRVAMYGELRKAMEPKPGVRRLLATDPAEWHGKKLRCLALPPDEADLRQDLAVLPLLYDGEGRLRLPPKDKPRKTSGRSEPCVRELLGGRSPDRGDALALAYFAWTAGQEYREASVIDGDTPLIY
jgi:hypothetical protein